MLGMIFIVSPIFPNHKMFTVRLMILIDTNVWLSLMGSQPKHNTKQLSHTHTYLDRILFNAIFQSVLCVVEDVRLAVRPCVSPVVSMHINTMILQSFPRGFVWVPSRDSEPLTSM